MSQAKNPVSVGAVPPCPPCQECISVTDIVIGFRLRSTNGSFWPIEIWFRAVPERSRRTTTGSFWPIEIWFRAVPERSRRTTTGSFWPRLSKL